MVRQKGGVDVPAATAADLCERGADGLVRLRSTLSLTVEQRDSYQKDIARVNAMIAAGEVTVDEHWKVTRT